MYQRKIPIALNCGLDLIREVLYGKWKIHIIYYIGNGALRPSDIQRKIPDATRRVLNIQLRQLELHDIITKEVFPQLPPKVEYSLTTFGKTLLPVIEIMGNWGDDHQEHLREVITSSEFLETGDLNA